MKTERYFYFIYDVENFYDNTTLIDTFTYVFSNSHFGNTYDAYTLGIL